MRNHHEVIFKWDTKAPSITRIAQTLSGDETLANAVRDGRRFMGESRNPTTRHACRRRRLPIISQPDETHATLACNASPRKQRPDRHLLKLCAWDYGSVPVSVPSTTSGTLLKRAVTSSQSTE
ncbi:hypothetical protein FRB95_014356 [Tulasnella sp. JGI-2019a]|nr:hypothetical protein FRB95_014356 [Tulasnella sp. JGI-2019a]